MMVRGILRCTFIIGLWRYLSNILGKLLCFIRKRKLSTHKKDETNVLLTSIKVQSETCSKETNLVDWENWGEGENENTGMTDGNEGLEDELFKDMEPVIGKAKVIHVKKTVKPKYPKQQEPVMGFSNNHSGNNGLLNPKYQVESELGVMDDTDGWDAEIDENFISQETESMIQTNKLMERERRLMEQKQKKMERELLRSQKKQDTYIGIKIK